jgi:hypothetical protein
MTTSNSLEYYAHQEGLFDPRFARKVVLLGAGSVGSHVAYHLAKMGVTDIEVWDNDVVASHNVPMSLYGPSDVGRYKVDALAELIERLAGTSIRTERKMYDGEVLRNTSVVACVDSMRVRKLLWERLKFCPTVDIFCDTRTAASYIEVLSVAPCDPIDIEMYEAMLFDDDQATRQTCGTHGIVYASSRASQVVAANLALFWQQGRKVCRMAEQCQTLDSIIGPTN